MRMPAAIAAYLGMTEKAVMEFTLKAPYRYRRYLIPKRNGGYRCIYHPSKETKAMQMAAIDLLDRSELVLPCVMGYVRKLESPLLKNATIHASKALLLQHDIKDFFPSIKADDFAMVCSDRMILDGDRLDVGDIEYLKRLFFVFSERRGWFLGIGAPSSPFISNWVMYAIDRKLLSICDEKQCTYSRYADDMCFSSDSKDDLLEAERLIVNAIANHEHPKLEINKKKRRISTAGSRRRITGLTITPDHQVKVPRATKRYVRSLLNMLAKDKLASSDRKKLSGYIAYIIDCEPKYVASLVQKYGARIVKRALRPYMNQL